MAAVVLQPLQSSITETRNGPKNAFCTWREDLLAEPDPLAADPDGHRLEVVHPAGEERVLHERAHAVRLHTAVGEQDVDIGVVRDDRVERAGVLVGVELEQDLFHDASSSERRAVRRTRSRRGSSNVR